MKTMKQATWDKRENIKRSFQMGIPIEDCASLNHIPVREICEVIDEEDLQIQRLYQHFKPKKKPGREEIFRDTIVVPYLVGQGHNILKVDASFLLQDHEGPNVIPDIVSIYNGIVHVSEVKVKRNNKDVSSGTQKAIGQLITQRFIHEEHGHFGVIYQAIVPSGEGFQQFLTPNFLKYLHELEIDVLFL